MLAWTAIFTEHTMLSFYHAIIIAFCSTVLYHSACTVRTVGWTEDNEDVRTLITLHAVTVMYFILSLFVCVFRQNNWWNAKYLHSLSQFRTLNPTYYTVIEEKEESLMENIFITVYWGFNSIKVEVTIRKSYPNKKPKTGLKSG